jgi:hypothetical protein
MARRLFPVSPEGYRVHALHSGERFWPQTNCYADLWIEIIHQLGSSPEAAFGFTLGQDFEGDQFTFFKPPLEDLYALYRLRAGELALYDDLLTHIEVQIARGRMVLVELDSFYLPDTRGVSYRETHGKTTVGINRLDRAARAVDYFHNEGFFHASGEDFDGLFGLLPEQHRADRLFPYAEMVRLPERAPDEAVLRSTAAEILARHRAQIPANNPLADYARVAGAQAQALMTREDGAFHLYAFNTLRQVGANFELLASHLTWLGGFDEAAAPALALAEGAKVAQFQLARAMRAKDPARFVGALEPLAAQHDALRAALCTSPG